MPNSTETVQFFGDVVKKLTLEVKKLKDLSKPIPIKEAYVDPDKEMKILQTKEIFSDPIYSVHAIIPGRAWLRGRDGKTITVTEGDMLDKYGKILVIDAPSGVVITSSGVTLR